MSTHSFVYFCTSLNFQVIFYHPCILACVCILFHVFIWIFKYSLKKITKNGWKIFVSSYNKIIITWQKYVCTWFTYITSSLKSCNLAVKQFSMECFVINIIILNEYWAKIILFFSGWSDDTKETLIVCHVNYIQTNIFMF